MLYLQGLCGIVAAHLSEKVVLTDADLDSLQLLQKNIDSNAAGLRKIAISLNEI